MLAKLRGVAQVITVVQKSKYLALQAKYDKLKSDFDKFLAKMKEKFGEDAVNEALKEMIEIDGFDAE